MKEIIKILKERIKPSYDIFHSFNGMYYYPCGVILKNGSRNDHVFFVNKKDFLEYWGWTPKEEYTIHLEDVEDIYESPYRLPKDLAQEIYSRGETGMGYYGFRIIMKDGRIFPYITGGAVDLIELPEGYTVNDIDGIGSPVHAVDKEKRLYRHKTYHWCLVDDL